MISPGEQTNDLLTAIALVKRADTNPYASLADRHEAYVLMDELARSYRTHIEHIARILEIAMREMR